MKLTNSGIDEAARYCLPRRVFLVLIAAGISFHLSRIANNDDHD